MSESTRADGRAAHQLRPLRFQNHIAPHAAGSTLVEWGNTRVICGVTVEEVTPFVMSYRRNRLEVGRIPVEKAFASLEVYCYHIQD